MCDSFGKEYRRQEAKSRGRLLDLTDFFIVCVAYSGTLAKSYGHWHSNPTWGIQI